MNHCQVVTTQNLVLLCNCSRQAGSNSWTLIYYMLALPVCSKWADAFV